MASLTHNPFSALKDMKIETPPHAPEAPTEVETKTPEAPAKRPVASLDRALYEVSEPPPVFRDDRMMVGWHYEGGRRDREVVYDFIPLTEEYLQGLREELLGNSQTDKNGELCEYFDWRAGFVLRQQPMAKEGMYAFDVRRARDLRSDEVRTFAIEQDLRGNNHEFSPNFVEFIDKFWHTTPGPNAPPVGDQPRTFEKCGGIDDYYVDRDHEIEAFKKGLEHRERHEQLLEMLHRSACSFEWTLWLVNRQKDYKIEMRPLPEKAAPQPKPEAKPAPKEKPRMHVEEKVEKKTDPHETPTIPAPPPQRRQLRPRAERHGDKPKLQIDAPIVGAKAPEPKPTPKPEPKPAPQAKPVPKPEAKVATTVETKAKPVEPKVIVTEGMPTPQSRGFDPFDMPSVHEQVATPAPRRAIPPPPVTAAMPKTDSVPPLFPVTEKATRRKQLLIAAAALAAIVVLALTAKLRLPWHDPSEAPATAAAATTAPVQTEAPVAPTKTGCAQTVPMSAALLLEHFGQGDVTRYVPDESKALDPSKPFIRCGSHCAINADGTLNVSKAAVCLP